MVGYTPWMKVLNEVSWVVGLHLEFDHHLGQILPLDLVFGQISHKIIKTCGSFLAHFLFLLVP